MDLHGAGVRVTGDGLARDADREVRAAITVEVPSSQHGADRCGGRSCEAAGSRRDQPRTRAVDHPHVADHASRESAAGAEARLADREVIATVAVEVPGRE